MRERTMIIRNYEDAAGNVSENPNEYVFTGADATLVRVNAAIAQLLELSADLHAHDDSKNAIENSVEYAQLLARMEFIGHQLLQYSGTDAGGLESCERATSYVADWLTSMHGKDVSELNDLARRAELERWESYFRWRVV